VINAGYIMDEVWEHSNSGCMTLAVFIPALIPQLVRKSGN